MFFYPKGPYVKFRPQSKTFIELTNPKIVLEQFLAVKDYSCLTKNETIRILYNERTYDIDVVEVLAPPFICVTKRLISFSYLPLKTRF